MLGQTQNQLLQKTEQSIQAKVPQALQDAFQRTVTAGLTIMYSPQSNKLMMQQLGKQGDQLQNVGEGAAKLIGVLYRQSGHKLPVAIAAPAAIVFMCEGLDFLEKSGKLQVTPDVIDQATQDTSAYVLQLFGVDQGKLHKVVANAPQAAAATPPAKQGIIGAAMGAQ